jgi:hypothetical protein
MLLHREDYYHKDDPQWFEENPDRVGLAEVIIAKQRNGPTGVVKMAWNSDFTRFMDYDPHATAPGGYNSISNAFDAFSSPEPAPQAPPRRPVSDAPFEPTGAPPAPAYTGFAPGRKSGPIENHRDGGGPEADFDDVMP